MSIHTSDNDDDNNDDQNDMRNQLTEGSGFTMRKTTYRPKLHFTNPSDKIITTTTSTSKKRTPSGSSPASPRRRTPSSSSRMSPVSSRSKKNSNDEDEHTDSRLFKSSKYVKGSTHALDQYFSDATLSSHLHDVQLDTDEEDEILEEEQDAEDEQFIEERESTDTNVKKGNRNKELKSKSSTDQTRNNNNIKQEHRPRTRPPVGNGDGEDEIEEPSPEDDDNVHIIDKENDDDDDDDDDNDSETEAEVEVTDRSERKRRKAIYNWAREFTTFTKTRLDRLSEPDWSKDRLFKYKKFGLGKISVEIKNCAREALNQIQMRIPHLSNINNMYIFILSPNTLVSSTFARLAAAVYGDISFTHGNQHKLDRTGERIMTKIHFMIDAMRKFTWDSSTRTLVSGSDNNYQGQYYFAPSYGERQRTYPSDDFYERSDSGYKKPRLTQDD